MSSVGACRPAHLLIRLARGSLLAGASALLLGLMGPETRASTPEAWKAYGQQMRQACLRASGLAEPRVVGQRVDVPELSLSLLLLEGRYPQAHMQGRHGREVCVFSQQGRRAVVSGADDLDPSRRP